MTTAATTSAVNTIADSDWLWLRPETAASISDLLEAPILRDAPTITWYAAGFKNTWLRITKTDGAVQLHTFEHGFLGLVPHELPWKGFSQRTRRPDEAEVPGLTPDLSKNLYAIAQMAYVAYDAWHDNKWALHREILTILSEHVPTLAQAYARADLTDGIQERPERQTQYAVHNALHEIDAIEALTDEPRGQAMLDPWFRAQQMLRVASKGHGEGLDARKTTLYMFEGPKPSYMLVLADATQYCSAFNLWLDEHMAPLLIDSQQNAEVYYFERTGIAWEHTRPLPTTVQGWKESLEAMDTMGDGIFQSLLSGRCRATSPSETLEAIEKWAHGTTCMKEWDNAYNASVIIHFGQWALDTWMLANPTTSHAMQSLLPAIDPRGPASQLDAWRQLLVLSNTQTKMPDFRLDGEQFGALLNT